MPSLPWNKNKGDQSQIDYRQLIGQLEQEIALWKGKQASTFQLAQRRQGEIETLQQQLKASEQSYTQELNRVNRACNAEIRDLKQVHKREIAKLMKDYDTDMAKKQTELNQTIHNHQQELSLKSLQFQNNTRRLREDIESLNAALLTNDDDLYRGELFTTSGLPAVPDDRISAQFSAIEQMVDNISRLQWKQNPAIWTNETLNRVRGQHVDRVLKKAIVQDHVWSLLYNYVFASPFRVFQEEGRALEMQWSRACGQGPESHTGVYQWPVPGAKTERWRYITIKECRDALRPPVPSDLDPRSRLRKGFTQSLEQFESVATFSLGNIVSLSAQDDDIFGRLFRKAATVWLEFVAHRCRIIIGLQGPADLSSEAKVAMAKGGGLKLTVIPTVGRYGSVRGTDLDSYKVIDKCEGASIII